MALVVGASAGCLTCAFWQCFRASAQAAETAFAIRWVGLALNVTSALFLLTAYPITLTHPIFISSCPFSGSRSHDAEDYYPSVFVRQLGRRGHDTKGKMMAGVVRSRFWIGPLGGPPDSRDSTVFAYGHQGDLRSGHGEYIQRLAALGIGCGLRLEHAGRYIGGATHELSTPASLSESFSDYRHHVGLGLFWSLSLGRQRPARAATSFAGPLLSSPSGVLEWLCAQLISMEPRVSDACFRGTRLSATVHCGLWSHRALALSTVAVSADLSPATLDVTAVAAFFLFAVAHGQNRDTGVYPHPEVRPGQT